MSKQGRVLRKAESGEVVLARTRLCIGFWCHFRGLQLVPRLPEDEGLLFVTGFEGKAHTTIHMFFMRFPIAVVWMDAQGKVVDKAYAKQWRPAYAPREPAQYFLEANPSLLDRVNVGDVLRWDESAS